MPFAMNEITTTIGSPSLAEDDSWAVPRPKAKRRSLVALGLLGASVVGLVSFAVGVNVGKSRTPVNANGVTGRGGFGGTFGGGAISGGSGVSPTTPGATPALSTSASTTTTVDPGLGGLLPGIAPAPQPPSSAP